MRAFQGERLMREHEAEFRLSNDTTDLPEETGASTGDLRANDPSSAGYTSQDRLFRSHFQRVNRLADRSFDQVRAAYQLGFAAGAESRGGHEFHELETDLQNGWLNVRTSAGDWASVRDLAEEGFELGRSQGRVRDMPPSGTSRSHVRPSFSDPVADDADPTAPQSPEQTLAYQHEDNRGPEWDPKERGNSGMDAPADKQEPGPR
jgi:hypothetical protein